MITDINQELKLAIEANDDDPYFEACCESAKKAYDTLMEDGHSGYSIMMTATILNRLIEGKPLTAISDDPHIWKDVGLIRKDKNGLNIQSNRCLRMSSLFKEIREDGLVTYSDVERVKTYEISNPKIAWSMGLVTGIIDEMFPIVMPYYPTKPYSVYIETFLCDEDLGDYDTVGIFYGIDPEGTNFEINRFFKELPVCGMVEINKDEYEFRKNSKFIEETESVVEGV